MAKTSVSQASVGKVFNFLTVIEEFTRAWERYWKCQCECGNQTTALAYNVKNGNTKSCGCRKNRVQHGHARNRTSEYLAWQSMRDRCYNPRHASFRLYGRKGITVCAQWQSNFNQFLHDVGLKPSAIHSLDRYPDKNGNYESNNVRWATPAEQMRNTNRTLNFTFQDRTLCAKDWAIELHLPYTTMLYRLKNWPIERAIMTPRLL